MIKIREGQDYSTLSVKKIIHSSAPNYQENLEKLKASLKNVRLDEKQLNELRNKIDYAESRINQQLELSLKIKYFVLPFGITSSFLPDETSDINKFKELGYIRKIKEYYKISILGMLFYIVGGIIVGLWLKFIP